MKPRLVLPFAALLVVGCEPSSSGYSRPADHDVPVEVDGIRIFIPSAWAAGLPWHERPWPNGLHISSGGWGSAKPWLGPIQQAPMLAPGQFYREDSAGKTKRAGLPDSFFYLTATFEFPARNAGTAAAVGKIFPFSYDQATISYWAPQERIPRPYVALLSGLRPSDGDAVGDGWREVRRPFAKRTIRLRFDTRNWTGHSQLPTRLAASFDEPSWYHFAPLDADGWNLEFETFRLPIQQWRSRYETGESLFAWLQTEPQKRNPHQRFRWWTDLRFRPTH